MGSLQSWVSDHKLASVAGLWASAIGVSLAVASRRTPLKPSLRIIHARMHAQALTLGVLSAGAFLHYMDLNNVLEDDGAAADAHEAFAAIADW